MNSPRSASGLELRVEELTHVYFPGASSDVRALEDINLVMPAGTTAALIGPSGSGKSTLMTLVAGLHRPTEGRILISDGAWEIDIASLSERELLRVRAQELSLVVQNYSRNLVPWGDAEDNIRFAQLGPRGYRRRSLPTPAQLLHELNLDHLARIPADRLSGGEKQRLAIAVGVASRPGLLLADEPTSQLDAANRDSVTDLLELINNRFGTTVLAVTHDPVVAERLGISIRIDEGRLREPPTSQSWAFSPSAPWNL